MTTIQKLHILRYVWHFLSRARDSDDVEFSATVGHDRRDGVAGYVESVANGTATIAIALNGGAQNRTLTTAASC